MITLFFIKLNVTKTSAQGTGYGFYLGRRKQQSPEKIAIRRRALIASPYAHNSHNYTAYFVTRGFAHLAI